MSNSRCPGRHAFDGVDRPGLGRIRGGSPWFIVWSQNDGPLVHAVIDDQLVAVDAAPDLSNGGLGIAVDETGVVAVAHYRRVFTDPTGAGLDVVVDAGQCCLSRVAIAFLAVGG